MNPEEYRRAEEIFVQVADLTDSKREPAIEAACGDDSALRAAVIQLLEGERRAIAGAFLEQRAIDDAARSLLAGAAGSSAARSFSPGGRLGPYEIAQFIGAGGMGEVYRARDRQLDRDVAIKVLPAAFAADAQYMARFEYEARVLASISHPNIATVYGIEQGALVMEFVEGANLRGPLPVEEAMAIARQIAVALEAAHERGIVHRDLKPANIRITPTGEVKLLDFGLAKSISGPAKEPLVSPTPASARTPATTLAGTIVGSAAYMAPEQALGKPADKRVDIWAFGVVFCEMLTGRRLFGGETVAETLAAVVRDAPDFSHLPADTPPHVRRLLERCLRRDPKLRLRDIGEARIALDEPPGADAAAPAPRRWWLDWLAAAAAAAAISAALLFWLRPAASEGRRLRLGILPPEGAIFSPISVPALSPDGRWVAYAAGREGAWRLWIRELGSSQARVAPDSDGAADPFWSPDSRSVAFFSSGRLKRTTAAGGPVLSICDAADGRGGSWNQNGDIIFAPTFASPLFRVPAAGGKPKPLTRLDEGAGESSHRFPWFLPDGRHFLYTVRTADPEKSAIFAGDLQSNERRRVAAAASNAAWAAPGLLLFLRGTTLMAAPFDTRALAVYGEAGPIAEQVDYLPGSIQGQFSVSQTGLLAYDSGGGSLRSRMTWFDRAGKPLETVGTAAVMQAPALSPDGKTVAVDRLDPATGGYDLWLYDLERHSDSRFTFDARNDMYPVWSPDGAVVLFASDRTGRFGLYRKAASGAEKEDFLYEMAGETLPTDWWRGVVIFSNTSVSTAADLWRLPLTGERKPVPLLTGKASEAHGRVSPDGRWLAYDSDESGQAQIYVETFPGGEGKWQVSSSGGSRPLWSRDGRELFFISADNRMMSARVGSPGRRDQGFEHETPTPLFVVHMPPTGLYDVSRDGRRFLILNGVEPEAVAPLTVVVNWR